MAKKILVLGAAGFIGTNICERLMYNESYYLVGIDNLKFGCKMPNVHDNFDFIVGDINTMDINYVNNFDIVISSYCSNIIYASKHPVDTYINNVIKFINTLSKYNGKIINLSTSSLYGNPKYFPTPEISITNTSNAYDTSKYIIEEYLKIRGNYTTFRLTNVFGKYQRPESEYSGVISRFIYNKYLKKDVIVNGNGEDTRDFNYVSNVIDAIISAIEKDSFNTEINIGTGKEISINKLLSILEIKDIEYVAKRKIDGISRRCLDISKAKELLGWEPKISLAEGLELTGKWIKENYVK
jgi:nucleoside-diphosphate-sugar epimerase